MKKENKVISQPLAKKIHALGGLKGVESEYWWTSDNQIVDTNTANTKEVREIGKILYPAYDTTELGEWLPEKIHTYRIKDYICEEVVGKGMGVTAHHEAEARGLMAEYLIKNKLLD